MSENTAVKTADIKEVVPPEPSKKEKLWHQWAARSLFFVGGFGAATWAPLVPFIKEELQLSEDVLGMLLLCVGIGSLLTMPFSGAAAAKWGCRRILTLAGICYGLVLLALSQVHTIWLLVPLILLLGAMMGAVDVVVNVLAIIVEKEAGKRIMSGMHAFWSVGGFVGSGIFSLWLTMGLNQFQATLIAAAIIYVLLLIFYRHLLDSRSEQKKGSLLVLPKGIVIFIGIIAFISFLAEGAMMDWGGVFLTSVKHFDMNIAGTGFMVFSAAMLLMRLTGDIVVTKLGGLAVTMGGAVLSAAGFLLLIFGEYEWMLYLGFFVIGIGSANIVPVFFSLMGRQKVMPVNQAVSAVSTLGYMGILMGPAAIGFVANATSLYVSFAMLALLVFSQVFIARYVYSKFS